MPPLAGCGRSWRVARHSPARASAQPDLWSLPRLAAVSQLRWSLRIPSRAGSAGARGGDGGPSDTRGSPRAPNPRSGRFRPSGVVEKDHRATALAVRCRNAVHTISCQVAQSDPPPNERRTRSAVRTRAARAVLRGVRAYDAGPWHTGVAARTV